MMKITVGGRGYVAPVSAACMGSRNHDVWQVTLARPKPTRSAFGGWRNAVAVDVIPVHNLLTWVLSLVSLALARARGRGQVLVLSVVSGAQASVGSGLDALAR